MINVGVPGNGHQQQALWDSLHVVIRRPRTGGCRSKGTGAEILVWYQMRTMNVIGQ